MRIGWKWVQQTGVPLYVWHCERCCVLHGVRWVDDVTHEYAVINYPITRSTGKVIEDVCQAKKIEIYLEKRLILVNPIEGVQRTAREVEEEFSFKH